VLLWETAEGALQEVKKNAPDLILLDINLPGKDGFSVLNELKSDLQTRALPVIFISGLSDEETVVKGLRTTAEDYIKKPFLLEEVKLRVEKVIDRIYNVEIE
jgi:DNA-binding response OmpR family regulator